MKFNQLRKNDQVIHIKSDLMILIESILQGDANYVKPYNLQPDEFEKLKTTLKTLVKQDCVCGMCIDIDKLKLLPSEFDNLIELVKNKLSQENF